MSVPRNDAPAHSRKLRDGELLRRIQTYRIKPAAKNLIAASRNGGTSRTPTRIARKGDPQTKQMIANASKICHEGGRAAFIFWLTKAYLDSQDALANQIWAMKNFYGQHKFRSSQFGFVSTGTVQRFFEKFRPSRVEARLASIPLLATST